MNVIEIFLPLYDNRGRRFERTLYTEVRKELIEKFGGLTAFTRSPAEGLWKDEGEVARDDIVIFEVMVDKLDRGWWSSCRRELERRFRQDEIVVRARASERL
ncbi:MAG TPA: hypothetical protein VGD10_00145 [Allosphingosinicella sp.]|uniref:hypothetical protein n=1 Tax=Allosphingosinicella sp. TaxID=2823234 RepID=UPI002EDBB43A